MIEKEYKFSRTDETVIEKVLLDENLHCLHMVLNQNDRLPEHVTNANVYMTVVRGRLSIGLNEQDVHEYEAGTLLKIPFQTRMDARNLYPETLELLVIKAPAPKN
jgi:quercetin dioxygenase-like cupin family protein